MSLYKSLEVVHVLRQIKKSFNVAQIIQCSTNHSTLYQRIIQHSTNNPTLYKSFNTGQIIQRSTNHSTWFKSFRLVQIFQHGTNHYRTLYKSLKSFSRSPYYLRFCHIAILKKFNTSHLYGNLIKTC